MKSCQLVWLLPWIVAPLLVAAPSRAETTPEVAMMAEPLQSGASDARPDGATLATLLERSVEAEREIRALEGSALFDVDNRLFGMALEHYKVIAGLLREDIDRLAFAVFETKDSAVRKRAMEMRAARSRELEQIRIIVQLLALR